jgi:hypothetical protein
MQSSLNKLKKKCEFVEANTSKFPIDQRDYTIPFDLSTKYDNWIASKKQNQMLQWLAQQHSDFKNKSLNDEAGIDFFKQAHIKSFTIHPAMTDFQDEEYYFFMEYMTSSLQKDRYIMTESTHKVYKKIYSTDTVIKRYFDINIEPNKSMFHSIGLEIYLREDKMIYFKLKAYANSTKAESLDKVFAMSKTA